MNISAREVSAPGKVSVLIGTALLPERVVLLERAVTAALHNTMVAEVIVVVNGQKFDASALSRLRARADVRVDYLSLGSYPAALRRGRELVTQPFFCFVDDDDELLPGSVASRLAKAEASVADVVVSNGYRNAAGVDTPYCKRQPVDSEDLALAILDENWFASCAPLFRADRVGIEFFDGHTKFLEWTLLVFKLLAAGRRFKFVPDYGFRINDTPVSLSKDLRGVSAVPVVLHELIGLTSNPRVRNELHGRLAHAHHACAHAELSTGSISQAWLQHFRSLALPGGASYWLYTRRLFAAHFVRNRR
ncbi:MAG: glycosyltransferase family 2 protein [Nitrococcus sp.]|nr:glycosyltransferase family 2 protein [Nitrococcus sp.]